jgi:hypothetical protein
MVDEARAVDAIRRLHHVCFERPESAGQRAKLVAGEVPA